VCVCVWIWVLGVGVCVCVCVFNDHKTKSSWIFSQINFKMT